MKKRYSFLLIVVLVFGMSYAEEPANFQFHSVSKADYPKFTLVEGFEHPRLFFNSSEIASLQNKAATTHQEIWLAIRSYAESEFGTTPPSESPDEGLTTYRNYGNRLIAFAFACVITEDDQYCNLAKTYLLTYATWDQWGENDYRDLGHGHMLMGNTLAYDWLYNHLTPTERQTVRESLAEWANKMYEASLGPQNDNWRNWWRKSYMQNHFSINYSALGMAGLALLGEDNRAQLWIDQASSQFIHWRDMLNGIEDGSWHESVNYQNYMLTLFLPFAVNLRDIQGIDLLPDAYLQNYPYWRIYNHLPDSTQFIMAYGNFEWDWGNGHRPQNVLRFIANEYNNGHAEWMAQQLIANDPRYGTIWKAPWYVFEFLYYNPTIDPISPNNLDKARLFSDLEGVIWRTGWEENDLVFGLKAGTYGGRYAFDTFTQKVYPWNVPCSETGCQFNTDHDHDDTNTFYMYRGGHWLAPESEGGDQTATAFHNTLLIDGQGQYRVSDFDNPDDFKGSDGFLEASANTTSFNYVSADATRRYKNISGIEDITRHVLFIRPSYLVMLDNLAADTAHQYTWVSHFSGGVAVDGNWVRGEADDQQILGVGIVSPQSFQTTTGNDGKPYVHIQPSSSTDDVRFINVLYPTNQTSWGTKPTLSLLEDMGEAAAIRVQQSDGSRDDILLTYTDTISTKTVGPYQHDAQVAVITDNSLDNLDKLFVYGGTFLKNQTEDTMLVSNLDQNEPFEAVYFGQTVAVSGHILTEVTLYAPQVEKLTINGWLQTFSRSGDYITFGGQNRLYLPMILKN